MLLLLATLSGLTACGTAAGQASGLRLAAAALVAVLAPLFWPGIAATAAKTALRVLGWSAAAALAAGLVVIATRLLGWPQPLPRVLATCAMLWPILLLTHAAVAAIEWQRRAEAGSSARESAGRAGALLVSLLVALPLCLGPVAELLTDRWAGFVDTVVALSPLTHLAVAGGNDLLRNDWLYSHSNLAALPVAYPGLPGLFGFYASVCLVLALLAFVIARPRHTARQGAPIDLI